MMPSVKAKSLNSFILYKASQSDILRNKEKSILTDYAAWREKHEFIKHQDKIVQK